MSIFLPATPLCCAPCMPLSFCCARQSNWRMLHIARPAFYRCLACDGRHMYPSLFILLHCSPTGGHCVQRTASNGSGCGCAPCGTSKHTRRGALCCQCQPFLQSSWKLKVQASKQTRRRSSSNSSSSSHCSDSSCSSRAVLLAFCFYEAGWHGQVADSRGVGGMCCVGLGRGMGERCSQVIAKMKVFK